MPDRASKHRWIRNPGILPAALLAAACDDNASDLTIRNGTPYRILNVSVTDSQNSWELGSLGPGAAVTFRQPLHGEAEAVVSWSAGGKRHSAGACYYTGGMPLRGSIIIAGDHLEYRCK